VASTGRRRAYLQALAGFSDPSPLRPAPAFAWRRHLFHRMRLIAREAPMSARRVVLSALVSTLVVVAAGWAAVSWLPLTAAPAAQELRTTPGPLEQAAQAVTPENPVPRRLHMVAPEPVHLPEGFGPTRVTLMVTVDHAGIPVEVRFLALSSRFAGSNVQVAGQHPATIDVRRFVPSPGTTGAVDGAPVLRGIEAMVQSAVTAVSQWRYDAPFQAPIAFETTIGFGPEGEVAALAGWDDGAIRVGANVAPPRKVKDVRPIYPPEAHTAGIQGIVIAEVRIGSDGRVERARIVRSIPELDQAAIAAIEQWEFTPVLMNGRAVPVLMTVTVQFALQ
jgi:protein TonB